MTTKDEILMWADGVAAYRTNDWVTALQAFQQIGDYSRIHFNSGMIYTQLDDYGSAAACYTDALAADPYLAAAYFQRAYCSFMTERYADAEDDYTRALRLLRDNDYIDYTQLGLKYRLYRCEIHYNRAMCAHSLGDSVACTQDVAYAQRSCSTDEQKNVIGRAARAGVETVTLFTVPIDAVFEVAETKVRNASERTYLKDAKVVGDTGPGSGWAGFDGALILDPGAANGAANGVSGRIGTVVRRAGSDGAVKAYQKPEEAASAATVTRPRRGTEPGARPTFADRTIDRRPSNPNMAAPVITIPRTLNRRSDEGIYSEQQNPVYDARPTISRNNSIASPVPRYIQERDERPRQPIRASTDYPLQRSEDSPRYAPQQQQQQQQHYARTEAYPSPSPSPSTQLQYIQPNNQQQQQQYQPQPQRQQTQMSGKQKIKVHTLAPLPPRTILLLLPYEDITHDLLLLRCGEKLGLRNPVLEFRDPDDQTGSELLTISDQDDLATAVEVMDGKWEFYVGEA
ncbi:hypothetical protein HDU86_008378 [Geranomyces michiganensis]|nr:hypothetical protein HDU86_008378 [Geranomyces michiganensis]